MIRKQNKLYHVISEKGKNLSSGYKTKNEAKKRLNQIEMFKRLKAKGYIK